MPRIRGVVLDVDGTLVDSNDAHARAWVDALAEAGYGVPFERVRPLIGMGADKLLPAAIGRAADGEEAQAIAARRGVIFRQVYLPDVEPFDGARELLEALDRRGLRLAVASSADESDLRPLLRLVRADALLAATTSADDAERSKPDPDIVAAALGRLGGAAEEAMMIGDTRYDVAAARQAGIGCIAFRCGGSNDRDLSGAVAVYDGPRDLLRHLPESPLVQGP
jgi:HAD superfamily hydrolase (TIGR01509 family)